MLLKRSLEETGWPILTLGKKRGWWFLQWSDVVITKQQNKAYEQYRFVDSKNNGFPSKINTVKKQKTQNPIKLD